MDMEMNERTKTVGRNKTTRAHSFSKNLNVIPRHRTAEIFNQDWTTGKLRKFFPRKVTQSFMIIITIHYVPYDFSVENRVKSPSTPCELAHKKFTNGFNTPEL